MSTPPPSTKTAHRFVWQSWQIGLASGLAAAVTLAAAPSFDDSRVVAALVFAAALVTATSHAAKRTALLWGVCIGLALGILASLEFIWQPAGAAGEFAPVAASLAVFLILGLTLGLFAEAVRVIHLAVHRGGSTHPGFHFPPDAG